MSFLSNFQLVASNEVLINEAISTDTTAPEISNASDPLFCEVIIDTNASPDAAPDNLNDPDPLLSEPEATINAHSGVSPASPNYSPFEEMPLIEIDSNEINVRSTNDIPIIVTIDWIRRAGRAANDM